MAYSHKTFRKCGSHNSELGALEGVEVKIGEKFRPPRKIALPVGFHPNDPSEVLSLSYDFTLENEIIAKAEEEKERLLEQEKEKERIAALKKQEQTNNTSTTASEIVPSSIFSNVGTDILQPIAVSSSAHKRNDSLGKNTFDLSDFEANATSPFELVELQTINDLDVLKSVLDPVSHSTVAPVGVSANVTATTATSSVKKISLPNKPLNYLSNHHIPSTDGVDNTKLNSRLSKSVPDLCNDPLVDLSEDSENNSNPLPAVSMSVASRSVSPPPSRFPLSQPYSHVSMGYGMPAQPFNYLQEGLPTSSTQHQSNPFQNSVNSQTSTSSISSTSSSLTSSTSDAQTAHSTTGVYSRHKLPPLQKPPPIPPRPAGRTIKTDIDKLTSSMQGMIVTDTPSSIAIPPAVTCSPGMTVIPGNNMTNSNEVNTSTTQSVIRRQPAQKRSKSNMDNARRHSTPLPPIAVPTSPPPPSYQSIISPPPPSYQSITTPTVPPSSQFGTPASKSQSVLPDPMPVLTDSEKSLVQYIAAMGFPVSRVARAVQRLGAKDREVVDFLVAVEELCQQGYTGDEAEVAVMLNDDDAAKALEFLKLTKTLKELGFEESHIHEALRAADNDRDKALDFLASISAS